jgi:hypothetical protein
MSSFVVFSLWSGWLEGEEGANFNRAENLRDRCPERRRTFRLGESRLRHQIRRMEREVSMRSLRRQRQSSRFVSPLIRNIPNVTPQDWILAQPRTPMASSILTSGPYMELLFEFMLPRQNRDGSFTFVAPLGSGAVPLIHLEDLGVYARYLFDNPRTTNGLDLKIATQHVHWADLAAAFTKVTGKPATYLDVTLDDYFDNYYPAGRKAVDRKIGTSVDKKDKTLQTWRQNFSGFWTLFKHSGGNRGAVRRDYEMMDRIFPDRVKSVEEWMRKVGYDGSPRPTLKDWVDGGIAKGQRVEAKL